ncbi:Lrp/AsnC family transcriptional regulator [Natronomonas gomsonensis]|uniref:Lrp/AsnC family transcriptional regulator n=1 Tax=Natronomonas gomsonensis TaxID=1046043 RepID=UPI0015C19AF7|nr:Lrp/AsnC family transcriptional regulator [Natronomonas gomsonensis]
MEYRLDEIDRHIIHALMGDARNTSAPTIAEAVNVSPGTVRNRINRLEEHGIIEGYTAQVDFERADGRLTNLYMCNVPVSDREVLAQEARTIPGVINVRELMTGRRNLHVLAVGEDTDDLRRISRALSTLGIEIDEEDLVQNETFDPYCPFGPTDAAESHPSTDFISLAGGAKVAEVTVRADAPITGHTLADAVERGLLDEEALVIAIERDDDVLTPHGETTIQSGDVITVLSREGDRERTLEAFLGTDDT